MRQYWNGTLAFDSGMSPHGMFYCFSVSSYCPTPHGHNAATFETFGHLVSNTRHKMCVFEAFYVSIVVKAQALMRSAISNLNVRHQNQLWTIKWLAKKASTLVSRLKEPDKCVIKVCAKHQQSKYLVIHFFFFFLFYKIEISLWIVSYFSNGSRCLLSFFCFF